MDGKPGRSAPRTRSGSTEWGPGLLARTLVTNMGLLPRWGLQSREGRLRRDRVVVVVCDILTADHDRIEPTCGVATAAGDAGGEAACGVAFAAADAGVRAAGAVLKSAADAVACTRPSAISTAATDACKLAT